MVESVEGVEGVEEGVEGGCGAEWWCRVVQGLSGSQASNNSSMAALGASSPSIGIALLVRAHVHMHMCMCMHMCMYISWHAMPCGGGVCVCVCTSLARTPHAHPTHTSCTSHAISGPFRPPAELLFRDGAAAVVVPLVEQIDYAHRLPRQGVA